LKESGRLCEKQSVGNSAAIEGFQRAWFWDGHYVWNDADAAAELLHAKRITQHNNFEWTLNQAHYTLESSTKPGCGQKMLRAEGLELWRSPFLNREGGGPHSAATEMFVPKGERS
jgi:hypothetical protein